MGQRMRHGGLRTKGQIKKTKINKPLISIVTVVYNGEASLENTLLSVFNQTYDNIEYIIIDGNSSDKTIEIVKKYEDKIDYWISESDNGVYFAMNKGIAFASGDYIALLNCGDWYESYTCSIIADNILSYKVDVYYGIVRIYSQNNKLLCVKGSTIDNLSTEMIAHPTCFISKNIYAAKNYNTKYRSAADYDFILQLKDGKYSFSFIEEILTNFTIGGISSSKTGHKETNRIMYEYGFQSRLSCFLRNIRVYFLDK